MFFKLPFAVSFSYLLQSNTRYFVNHLDRFTYRYVYVYVCCVGFVSIVYMYAFRFCKLYFIFLLYCDNNNVFQCYVSTEHISIS